LQKSFGSFFRISPSVKVSVVTAAASLTLGDARVERKVIFGRPRPSINEAKEVSGQNAKKDRRRWPWYREEKREGKSVPLQSRGHNWCTIFVPL
jgi:hypothetical protein